MYLSIGIRKQKACTYILILHVATIAKEFQEEYTYVLFDYSVGTTSMALYNG